MQLSLFAWDRITTANGYECLSCFEFDRARQYFSSVLKVLPDHADAGTGIIEVDFWEKVIGETQELQPESAIQCLWDNISDFQFSVSEHHR